MPKELLIVSTSFCIVRNLKYLNKNVLYNVYLRNSVAALDNSISIRLDYTGAISKIAVRQLQLNVTPVQ